MAIATTVKHVLVGTAGHIDHGKTRLIGRLTGIDTDRLPEEKQRGISIDLGFAHWEADGIQFGIVDVPGHERFVRNMVAGATGINLALLIVAADDGVMPQTREHLEIMQLLGIADGIVAITKIDLVEPELVELVEAEVADLVRGTFLEDCAMLRVSAHTGEGLDELKRAIAAAGARIEAADLTHLFRMPIDRVFSLEGHGTVVTGSVLSGGVAAGDTLELLPQQRVVRVRSVQNHGARADSSGSQQRTALNLAGVKTDEIGRGQELASAGYLRPTKRLIVRLQNLASSPLTLKDRLELNLHLGTAEVPARLALKGRRLAPGEQAYAELRTRRPVVAGYGQRFILRRLSPPLTLAGGTILDPYVEPRKRLKSLDDLGAGLESQPAELRLSALLAQYDSIGDGALDAAWRAGIAPESYASLVEALTAAGDLARIGAAGRQVLLHRQRLESLRRSVMRAIRAELARYQPCRVLPRNTLLTACREITQGDVLEAVFAHLLKTGDLVATGNTLGPADAQARLTKSQQQARDRVLAAITGGGLAPPTTKELADALAWKVEQLEPLLLLCEQDGLLARIAEGLWMTPQALEQATHTCEQLLAEDKAATISQLREAWGVSRKYAVPLSEYLDQQGITLRRGDTRVLGPKASQGNGSGPRPAAGKGPA